MAVNKAIFKAYDLRGLYPEEINEDAAYAVGRAFVEFFSAKTVAVGRDMRLSSDSLFASLSKGITDAGADVISIGLCTTPMLSFAVARFGYDCGIMISASHNPGQYNAFKLIGKKALQLSSETGIDAIKKIVSENEEIYMKDSAKDSAEGDFGKITEKDVLPDYLGHVMKSAEGIRGLRIAADYGNGVGAISGAPCFEELDVDYMSLYEKPDGAFPNHPANPHDLENLEELRKIVMDEKADIGIFFDGDADRSYLVDENGEIVMPDLLLALLAEHELEENKGEKVYYDLRFSRIVGEKIREYGGFPVMMRVGNPFYKEKLVKEGGVLAGELSGHIMFKENYCIDDGLFAAIKTMSVMCREKKPLSELILPLKKYHGSEEINMKVADADKAMEKARGAFKDGKSTELDGVYISYPNWWFNLRKSNTEPLVRLRLEADTEELLEEKKKELLKLIRG